MRTVMTQSRQIRWMAGTVAALATSLTLGGPLAVAEHYALIGANSDASGYHAAVQARRIGCPDTGNARTAVISPRGSAKNS